MEENHRTKLPGSHRHRMFKKERAAVSNAGKTSSKMRTEK
jgi:hypothetical protein